MDVGARACARMRSSVVLSMYVSVSNFLSLSFHICSTFFFFFLSPALLPAATFIKSSAFDLERRWFESQLNAFMWNSFSFVEHAFKVRSLGSERADGVRRYNLCYMWYPHIIILSAEAVFVLSLNFVVHYYAYLCLTEAESPWFYTRLMVFSGKNRAWLLFLFSNSRVGILSASVEIWSFFQKTSVCIPSVRKEMGEDIQEHRLSIVLANLETQKLTHM